MLAEEHSAVVGAPIVCDCLTITVNGADREVNVVSDLVVEGLGQRDVAEQWDAKPARRILGRDLVYEEPNLCACSAMGSPVEGESSSVAATIASRLLGQVQQQHNLQTPKVRLRHNGEHSLHRSP